MGVAVGLASESRPTVDTTSPSVSLVWRTDPGPTADTDRTTRPDASRVTE